ncbi:hypothetical protein T06_9387 [Trichinella sp. T6]|nr:hypothetical protein T06_9387 [Trichinella sp. T6]
MELCSVLSRDQISLRFVLLQLKSYKHRTLLEITNFWKVLRQINAYVLNKWLLKFQCPYLNNTGKQPIRYSVETDRRWLTFGIGNWSNTKRNEI